MFSRSLPAAKRDGLIFTHQSPATLVGRLRKNKGKNIWLMGGGELARDFLKADFVDELYIGMVPVLVGEGVPLFPPGFLQLQGIDRTKVQTETVAGSSARGSPWSGIVALRRLEDGFLSSQ